MKIFVPRCEECGYAFIASHQCPPKWEVIREREDWRDAVLVYAQGAADAAIRCAERSDVADGLVSGLMLARPASGGEVEAVEVWHEISIDYHARRVPESEVSR